MKSLYLAWLLHFLFLVISVLMNQTVSSSSDLDKLSHDDSENSVHQQGYCKYFSRNRASLGGGGGGGGVFFFFV